MIAEECIRNKCDLPRHVRGCKTYPRVHPMTGATQSQLNACVDPPDGCGRVFSPEEIDTWDRLTLKEASLSGLCKKCQDEVFGPCGEDCGH